MDPNNNHIIQMLVNRKVVAQKRHSYSLRTANVEGGTELFIG
jgi:hypothetical protein